MGSAAHSRYAIQSAKKCLKLVSISFRSHWLQLRGIYGVQADGLLALAAGVGPAVITPTMSQEFLK
jgi:hypothetical protein